MGDLVPAGNIPGASVKEPELQRRYSLCAGGSDILSSFPLSKPTALHCFFDK